MQPKCEKQVITLRNRLDVLLFVFVVKHFLSCCDVEMNPGPTKGNFQNDAPDGPNSVYSDCDTLNTEHTPLQSSGDTSVSPDVATHILEAIRQQIRKASVVGNELESYEK